MKLLRRLLIILIFFHLFYDTGIAQDYLWPTDASQYLTSSFAEYRPGHFHAGIDIKTWGRIGYKVFAIRDGYIMRIGISPYGYGRVLYQRLDTGEIAVYAHLSRFNNALERYAKGQQQRKGEYRINHYLKANQFPVKKGAVIAYTGASGIGSPHLHFEMRDAKNNPTNPFLFGYQVEDTIPPLARAVSVTPLDFRSRVDSDVIPLIEKPVRLGNGKYQFTSTPLVSGNIGFAIDCYDQANGVSNKFAVYKLDFYVDGNLFFSAKYDKFSYSVTGLIDLDRDYRLMSRGVGRFQKLYKSRFNQLSFYRPQGSEAGIIACNPATTDNPPGSNRPGKGKHQFVIELYDFFGNLTTVAGNFIVGEKKQVYADFQFVKPDKLYLTHIRDKFGHEIQNPDIMVSLNRGRSWKKMPVDFTDNDSDSTAPIVQEYLLQSIQPNTVVKIRATDDHRVPMLPAYYIVENDTFEPFPSTNLIVEQEFYDDYIRFNVTSDRIVKETPRLFVQQIGLPAIEVKLWQNRFNEYIGVYQLVPGKDGPLSIETRAKDLSGREILCWDQIDIHTVSPYRGGSIQSKDNRCRVAFNKNAVYENLFLRIENRGFLDDPNYDFVGAMYEVFPQDIPLKRSGTIKLQYPADDPLPEKLGIYRVGTRRHSFAGNAIDSSNHTIASSVSNLGAFTLIRDVEPPTIEIRYPNSNAQLRNGKPTLLARVRDELSGIANERSIVMRLDGKKVIAEFDPDAKTVKFKPDVPLSAGEHSVSVWAKDRCNNERIVTHNFYIVK